LLKIETGTTWVQDFGLTGLDSENQDEEMMTPNLYRVFQEEVAIVGIAHLETAYVHRDRGAMVSSG
jgi:hypothetical protein